MVSPPANISRPSGPGPEAPSVLMKMLVQKPKPKTLGGERGSRIIERVILRPGRRSEAGGSRKPFVARSGSAANRRIGCYDCADRQSLTVLVNVFMSYGLERKV
jgi:hypothetical protein